MFKPWTSPKAIAEGSTIRSYVRETATEHGIDQHIRFHHKVTRAEWSSAQARWTVTVEAGGETSPKQMTCSFLFMCSGYYKYEAGFTPHFEGLDSFAGDVVHPQKWTEDIDYSGKSVVVIGSGATAVTLVPEMAKSAAHVTMLQRSPTYIVSRPSTDKIANMVRRFLPGGVAYKVSRWKNILLGMFFYNRSQKRPERVKRRLLQMTRDELGPNFDIETHFTPKYNPWEQRLCLVPDSDLFAALKSGKASVVTDHIEKFDSQGVQLKSGERLDADLVVTATGLELQMFGGMEICVDGRDIQPGELVNYKGMMFADLPNFANTFGYTNASWTLKADLTSHYVCRLINHMDRIGATHCTPRLKAEDVTVDREAPLSSGYFARALDRLPKQGSRMPWKINHNYFKDMMALRFDEVEDGEMEFATAEPEMPAIMETVSAATS
ncbi:MAG: NAD(P)/FAD-dependent oxidoreductase [Pseudomonadota bacterium]